MNDLDSLIESYVEASNRLNLLRIQVQAAQDTWSELQAQEQAATARTIEAHEKLKRRIAEMRAAGA